MEPAEKAQYSMLILIGNHKKTLCLRAFSCWVYLQENQHLLRVDMIIIKIIMDICSVPYLSGRHSWHIEKICLMTVLKATTEQKSFQVGLEARESVYFSEVQWKSIPMRWSSILWKKERSPQVCLEWGIMRSMVFVERSCLVETLSCIESCSTIFSCG